MLATGDHQIPAQNAARQAGITQVYAGLLPEQKLELVEQLKRSGKRVGMAGDGWNDAPRLLLPTWALRWAMVRKRPSLPDI